MDDAQAAPTGNRREAILDAAYSCIAELGYDRATTARICERAGVSSGTFFHYFPTKSGVLVGILERGVKHTRNDTVALVERAAVDAEAALDSWFDRLVAEATDPHLTGFAAALGTAPDEARISELLRAEADLVHGGLTALMAEGQRQGRWRTDRAADRLATWVGVIADGVLGRSIDNQAFDAASLRPDLSEMLRRILAGAGSSTKPGSER